MRMSPLFIGVALAAASLTAVAGGVQPRPGKGPIPMRMGRAVEPHSGAASGAMPADPATGLGIIVQGGIAPKPGCGGSPATVASGSGMVAIGPKQDDPVVPPPPPGDMTAAGGSVSLGPKQDDPGPPPSPDSHAAPAAMVTHAGMLAIGPKQDDPAPPHPEMAGAMSSHAGMLAIGPKQDDPAPPQPSPNSLCKPASR